MHKAAICRKSHAGLSLLSQLELTAIQSLACLIQSLAASFIKEQAEVPLWYFPELASGSDRALIAMVPRKVHREQ